MFSNLPTTVIQDQINLAKVKKMIWLGQTSFENFEPLIEQFDTIWTESNSLLQRGKPFQSLTPLMEGHDRFKLIEIWDKLCSALNPNHPTTIIFTSGSTASPKGVVLSQHNLVTQIKAAHQCFPTQPTVDLALSCLPLAHVFERMVTYFYLYAGISIHWVDDLQKVAERMKSSKPTLMTTVPRLLEKVYNAIHAKIHASPWPIKLLGKRALTLALSNPADKPLAGINYFISNLLFYKKFRLAFGGRMTMLISGGAALPTNLATFFNNIGVPTYQGYGLSESSPVITANCPGHNKIGSVGRPFPNIEVRICDEHDEVLSRGPNTMLGYHLQPELTSEMIDSEHWLHTGDQGRIDEDGYLYITGRIKELCKTSNGKYVRPVPIEAELCAHGWIDQAMIVADAKPYVTALLTLDEKALAEIRTLTQLPHANTGVLLEHTIVRNSIQTHLDSVNKKLSPWEQVRKYAWMPQALSVESGELTPTMKIKRHVVQNKYGFLIDSIYNAASN